MVAEIVQEKRKQVENCLKTLLTEETCKSEKLREAMNYSLLAGGKRIRPILFLAALDMLGVASVQYISVAGAIECIHTYSLIHDDLPQMDNDEYRRGRLTNHKVYGAGVATMAGDGLLTFAFELLAKDTSLDPKIQIRLIRLLAEAAGASGMVAGQVLDIEAEGNRISLEALQKLDALKTGCLLTVPLDMAAEIASCSDKERHCLHQYGIHLGQLFQITDDLMDQEGALSTMGKLPGQDIVQKKSTYVSLLGAYDARKAALKEAEAAAAMVEHWGSGGLFFKELPQILLHRTK